MSAMVDFSWLPELWREELPLLMSRFGLPLFGCEDLGDSPYLRRIVASRSAEVCMVVRRPVGTLLIFRKPFYPAGILRLMTGGVERGELILDALLREVHEETGLEVEVTRFLAASTYLVDGQPRFASFAFLLDERGGTLGALDPHEQVEVFREITPDQLPALADQMEALPGQHVDLLDAEAHEWGLLRALNHRLVWHALAAGSGGG